MHPLQKMPQSVSIGAASIHPAPIHPVDKALPVPTDRAKDFIITRLARGDKPERIAAGLRALFEIEIAPAQVIPYWRGELTPATQTERRPDKESVQFPADEETEPLFTRMPDSEMPDGEIPDGEIPDGETPRVVSERRQRASAVLPDPVGCAVDAREEDAAATQTGPGQNEGSLQIPADTVDEPTAQDRSLQALADLARARLGIAPESAPDSTLDSKGPTQTGRRQNQRIVLTDEVRAFIVRGLARYETPTQVAASVKANFDIEITRRQVFAYDPAGSRPPAQRWIDLHAATRAKFMQATAEIGVAQKVVRLRMLDRFAHRADEQNYTERAARFLAQAAKECGGFYERYQRPKAAA